MYRSVAADSWWRVCAGPATSFIAFALTVGAAQLGAQSVPKVALGKPQVEFAESFDNVNGIRELRDGRLIVSDLFARSLSLVDLQKGTRAAIGRQGKGPNEYVFPSGLLAMPGDSTWVPDQGQRRFLRITPTGTVNGSVPFPEGLFGQVRGVDSGGRLYFVTSGFTFGPGSTGTPAVPDSLPVLRWDRSSTRFDTLGRIKGPVTKVTVSGGATNKNVMVRTQPFSPQDDWAVATNGAVGVLRVGRYSAEWWMGAKHVAGPLVAYTPVTVSAADKEAIRKVRNNPRGRLVITDGGVSNKNEQTIGGAGPAADEPEWPAKKPPFVDRTAQVSPNGQLWVQRSMPAGAVPTYDIFDGAGTLVRQVTLPVGTKLVGLGRSRSMRCGWMTMICSGCSGMGCREWLE